MNYTLNQLQVFLKITQTLSVTKAAEELHLTQPAVSIQLKNLQDHFDIPLTEVVGRKIYITDFGKEIAKAAGSILEQVAAINQKMDAFRGMLTGRLKLSIVSTGAYVMPYFLSPFMKQHQNLELVMDVTNQNHVIENLEQNTVDFVLLSYLPTAIAIERLDLVENKLFLVGNGELKLKKAGNPKVVLKDLPLIFREHGSGTRQFMEDYMKRNGLSIEPKMELTSNAAVKEAVMAGLGYSIIPQFGMKHELENGNLQIIPLTGFPLKTIWRLVWLKGKRHTPVAAAFLDYMKKEKSGIVAKQFSTT
ncbi:MAG: LysR family transcriptional regulator [Chryseolinea sp.]